MLHPYDIRDLFRAVGALSTIVLLVASMATSCKDQDPPVLSIEGSWSPMIPAHPEWVYDFREGLLTQSITDFGVVITTLTYPYAVRQDTVWIGGDANNLPRVWLLAFECPDIVRVNNISPGAVLSPQFWLKRR